MGSDLDFMHRAAAMAVWPGARQKPNTRIHARGEIFSMAVEDAENDRSDTSQIAGSYRLEDLRRQAETDA
jgi:hypothetical protein